MSTTMFHCRESSQTCHACVKPHTTCVYNDHGTSQVYAIMYTYNIQPIQSAYSRAFQVAPWGKNPPAMQEMREVQVCSLGGEDPLEKGMATHSSLLTWRIRWTEEPEGLQPIGSQRLQTWLKRLRMHARQCVGCREHWSGSLSLLQGILLTQRSNWVSRIATEPPIHLQCGRAGFSP